MKKIIGILLLSLLAASCSNDDSDMISIDNPEISLNIPSGFPELNTFVSQNKPTKYGVELGKKLFSEKGLVQIIPFPAPPVIFRKMLLQTGMHKPSEFKAESDFVIRHPFKI